ncbi:polynucleotide adenylyltransferase PcnB [Oleiagrimonas sp.]|jgi:poly(A) polymerase|uniref:polynucleotide adenylyltransferase PcnB n=1 Tax=Oleiagrimonas sp. TaxID=2010330 RepID=UPI00262E05F4|nr:polynucleotide adenylyltransferase PcnB [Oleiagrimonas sp.]MDA3912620.1 polynucleotide adenylyltransferase PcnB [Oleiagrimonas sp.]
MRIIPRDQHSISRRHISKAALRVLYGLHEAGYQALLVGGAVRDLLLGVQPKDFDIATDATPEQVRKLFRNCRLIGRRFRLAHVMFGREIIEVATFRGVGDPQDSDRHIVDGRIVRDNIWGSIEEDAVRRDFRANAMYYDIADFSVRDDVGGMQDLDDRVLRLIGDPETRYREDPVRMLRAARLAAKLEFSIDPSASAPFAELAPLLGEAPPARLFDESLKLFMAGYALKSFRMLRRYGLLAPLFPATARALDAGDQVLLEMIENGMANTDARIAEDKPVTPAFLFAVLLWGEVREIKQGMMDEGAPPSLAWQRASHQVVMTQSRHVAIPRRFTHVMEEIWTLQPRFAHRTPKRVFQLLEHPRFRAAYDFLLLRAGESDEMAEMGAWWTRAQEVPEDALSDELGASVRTRSGDAPRKRRRRRRRGRNEAGDKAE